MPCASLLHDACHAVACSLLKLANEGSHMIKLTRLNRHPVVVNPDHVYAADATPDTTLRLLGGDCIIVLETLEELVAKVVEYRRHIRDVASDDAISVAAVTERQKHDAARKEHDDR